MTTLSPSPTTNRRVENPRVRITEEKMLSQDWGRLNKVTFAYLRKDGTWQSQTRETYDRGHGAALLLFNPERRSVVLTRQFRLPVYVNRDHDGNLIEACAGLLDGDDPEACIQREAEEETGYRIRQPRKLFEAYMSPGSVTEKLHFFIAHYAPTDRLGDGGGVAGEGEDIEVLELPLDNALEMIQSGAIQDGKTIMLLQHAALHGLGD